MREVVECIYDGRRMFGTLHRPDESTMRAACPVVLMMNPGHVGRAGSGDLMAVAADELAALGYPVYRYDFEGLGDTAGELPTWELEFFLFLQQGGHAKAGIRLIDEVSKHPGADGVVLIGLCGGAITSVFAADERVDAVRGVVMLDTDFSILPSVDAGNGSGGERRPAAQATGKSRLRRFIGKLGRTQTWLRFMTGENRFSWLLRPIRPLLMPFARILLGRSLPSDANRPLIYACRRVVDRGIPVMTVTAAGKLRDLYAMQVDPIAFGGEASANVRRLAIPNTNHVFTAGGAKRNLIGQIEDFVLANWPRADAVAAEGGAP